MAAVESQSTLFGYLSNNMIICCDRSRYEDIDHKYKYVYKHGPKEWSLCSLILSSSIITNSAYQPTISTKYNISHHWEDTLYLHPVKMETSASANTQHLTNVKEKGLALKKIQEEALARLPLNTLYIVLYIRGDPPRAG